MNAKSKDTGINPLELEEEIYPYITGNVRLPDGRRLTPEEALGELVALVNAHLYKEVKELVGEENRITKPSGNSRLDQQVQSEIDGANKLRAEILAAAQRKYGGTDE